MKPDPRQRKKRGPKQRRQLVLDSLTRAAMHRLGPGDFNHLPSYRARLFEQLDTHVSAGAWARTLGVWRDLKEDQHDMAWALVEVLLPKLCPN